MRPHQTQVRKMRQPGRHAGAGRSADGIRQTYYDGDIRAAREAARHAAEADNQVSESSDQSGQ